jgi:hypothetical protein
VCEICGLRFVTHSRLLRPGFAHRDSDPSPQPVSVAYSPCHTVTPGTFSPGMSGRQLPLIPVQQFLFLWTTVAALLK